MYTKILATGHYLPRNIVTNQDLEQQLDTTDAWIVQRTGIKQRHIAQPGSESNAHMASLAAREALANAGVRADQLDMIMVATCTPDKVFPSTACLVQQQLGIRDCPALDIGAACSGFIYALSIADQYIRAGAMRYILVIGSEVMSRLVDWQDRATCVLFGDGAGAVLLGPGAEAGIIATHLHADGNYEQYLYANHQYQTTASTAHTIDVIHMAGREVFKVAVNKLGDIVEETLVANNFTKHDIDWLVPHQANIRIIQAMAQKLDLPMTKVILTVDRHANTSAASIPLAMHDGYISGKIRAGNLLLLEAFGAGFTWGSALVRA